MRRQSNLVDSAHEKIEDKSGRAGGVTLRIRWQGGPPLTKCAAKERRSLGNVDAPLPVTVKVEPVDASPERRHGPTENVAHNQSARDSKAGLANLSTANNALALALPSGSSMVLDGPWFIRTSTPRTAWTEEEEMEAVRRALTANGPLDANGHFLLSLLPYLRSTPPDMEGQLRIEMLNIVSMYSQGRYPSQLLFAEPWSLASGQ